MKILFFSCKIILLICYSSVVLSEPSPKNICFNFNIITKKTIEDSESSIYEKQKTLVLNQLSQTQLVFEKNRERHCPEIKFSIGIIKQVRWNEARRLSQPVDQEYNETIKTYQLRKLIEASDELQQITKKLNEHPEIKYHSFLELRPGRAIIKAEKALQKMIPYREELDEKELINSNDYEVTIRNAIAKVKMKLDAFEEVDSAAFLERAEQNINQYEQIDQLSANTWQEGELTFWNDIEAQNTSVELKNLLQYYRAQENQCLDVYVIPSGKTPSGNNIEAQKNGKWTQRGGVAMSSNNFPLTTGGKGHAILLTYNSRITENRLAHELGHLLLDKGDAHEGKMEKDLMHENSKGGFYLDEMECDKIKENVKMFFGGSN